MAYELSPKHSLQPVFSATCETIVHNQTPLEERNALEVTLIPCPDWIFPLREAPRFCQVGCLATLRSLPPMRRFSPSDGCALQVLSPNSAASFTVLVNQTATHAVPTVLNSLSSALLRAVTEDPAARLTVTNHPLPTLTTEQAISVSRDTGGTSDLKALNIDSKHPGILTSKQKYT